MESAETAEKAKSPKKKGKKKHIKWFVLGGVVLLVGIFAATCVSRAKEAMSAVAMADVTVLAYQDMETSISATGIVESAESHPVYSTMAYTIAEVMVEVGDTVEPGDVLCQLDRQALERQIEQQELNMTQAEKAAAQSIKSARDNYNNLKNSIEEGTNQSLISADSGVSNAYNAYVNAQTTYDEYYETLRRGQNSQLLSLESAVDNAANAYDNAKVAYDKANTAYQTARAKADAHSVPALDSSAITNAEAALQAAQANLANAKTARETAYSNYNIALANWQANQTDENLLTTLNTAESALQIQEQNLAAAQADAVAKTQALQALQSQQASGVDATKQQLEAEAAAAQSALSQAATARDSAESAYDNALASYRAAIRGADSTLDAYARNVEAAYEAYQTALKTAEATGVAVDDQLEGYKNQLASVEISGNTDTAEYALATLYEDLEDTAVKAEHGGTVTAVYAEVGSPGSGLLFVIEDIGNLIVETTVKSYDVGTVKEGMPVTIKSDATGDEVYDGVIKSIAPTSNKNALGETDTSTADAVFATEVAVTSKDTGLRIGMNARLNYILDQAEHVLAAPFDAVYENEQGESCVLALIETRSGHYRVEEYPVACGIENDLDVAVSGPNIAEGLRIINQPGDYMYLLGQEVTLTEHSRIVMTMPG